MVDERDKRRQTTHEHLFFLLESNPFGFQITYAAIRVEIFRKTTNEFTKKKKNGSRSVSIWTGPRVDNNNHRTIVFFFFPSILSISLLGRPIVA